MDQPKIERVLRLIMMLSGNVNYSIDEIACKLCTSSRTIYRYIDTFKEAGFVVYKNGESFKLGKLSKEITDISKLVHFTEEEAFIVNKLIDSIDNNNLLKQNLKKKLASVYNFTALADCVVKKKDADNIHALINAIEHKKQVVLHNYSSSHTGIVRDRHVEPFGFTTNYIQVWCYDTDDGENKLFSTSRIEAVGELETAWKFESAHNQGFVDIFRFHGFGQKKVKLKLGLMSHNILIEEYPLAERDTRQLDSNHWLLETKVCTYRGVGRFAIGLADDIEIVDTPGLEKYITEFKKKYLQ